MKLFKKCNYQLLILILILGIFFSYLSIKEISYIKELKKEIVLYKQLLDEKKEFTREVAKNENISSPLLLIDIWEAVEMLNLELLKFNCSEEGGPDKLYSITLSGNYQDFIKWINTIENLAYLKNIEELQIQRLNQNYDELLFIINLKVFNM